VIELDGNSFRTFMNSKFSVVEFYSEYCPYCRVLSSFLGQICKEMGIDAGKINVSKYWDIGEEFQIELVPTVIAFNHGEAVGGFMGMTDKVTAKRELKNLFDKYGKGPES